MRITRIYQSNKLAKGTEVQLDEQASHHLIHVLRLKIGAKCTIFNGSGGEFGATISRIEKRAAFAQLDNFIEINRESPLKLHLAQGLSRTEKMDLVIQKATELGVSEITPLLTEYSNIKRSTERDQKHFDHWQKIIINACEQCGRNILPTLNPIQTFSEYIQNTQATLKLIFHTNENTSPLTFSQKPASTLLMIGPEGGFSETEMEEATQHYFQPTSLGPRILRTETAAITALSILQNQWGDLS